MGIQAGVGMSHHRNPQVAGQEAVHKALEAAGIEKPDFLLLVMPEMEGNCLAASGASILTFRALRGIRALFWTAL